jgi:integrase
MASIDKRPNGKWRARYREHPNGPQKTRTFDRKTDAQRFLDGVQGDLLRGEYINPANARMLFQDYAEEWRRAQVHRRSTATQCETYLRKHAYPVLGARPLGQIRRSEVQGWVKGMSESLAPGSVELAYRWVATIFRSAVSDRLIPASPCIRIALPKKERGEVTPLAVEDVHALALAIAPRYRAMVVVASGAGLRLGEVLGLTVDRVDFLRQTIRVDRQLVDVLADGVPEFGPPKTQAGYRTVPVPSSVIDELSEHVRIFGTGPEDLLFTSTLLRPLRRQTYHEAWHRARDLTEVPTWATFHDLRHFYASMLIQHGCSVKAVQKRLGHQSAMETLDTYGHLWPDGDDETRDAVESILGAFGRAS